LSASKEPDEPEPEEPQAPFTFSKRQSIVASFAQAVLGGQVSVDFPLATEYKPQSDVLALMSGLSKEEGREIDPVMLEAAYKKTFNENAMIVLGVTAESSERQQQVAVNWFVETIWKLRNSRRIQGNFLAIPNIESRVKKLEEEIERHNRLLNEMEILLRLGNGGTGH